MTILIDLKSGEGNRKKRKITYFLWLSFFIFSLALLSLPSWAKGNGNKTCDKVTKTVYRACKHGTKDDFWINAGICINTTDNKWDLRDCKRDMKKQYRESNKLCKAQKKARNEVCDQLDGFAYKPEIDPANFLSAEEIAANPNPYFPLTPGLVKTFKDGDETVVVTVTSETVEILGVTCIVIRDIVSEDGKVIEDTDDWYAQDRDGNVWYFGEISKNFEDGELNHLDGSWKAGVDNAFPGILMKANPMVGDIYRQEYALGEAEDMAEILSITETAEATPVADCSATCIVTRDYLPTEPDAEELKYYAPGIGNILVINQNNGEREELVEVIIP